MNSGIDPPAPAGRDDSSDEQLELDRLLQLLYQLPVGVINCGDAGDVRMLNPAAVRMFAPIFGPADDLSQLFPLLHRVAPELVQIITENPGRMGRLDEGRRIMFPGRNRELQWLELLTVRVDRDQVMIVCLDVTRERRLAEIEHRIAAELQSAMLGQVDPVQLPVGVLYRPASEDRSIGGDWYDVIDLTDSRVGLAVGDVSGHNLHASAVMGQLRSAARAIAVSASGPAELLDRLDHFAGRIDGAIFSTFVYAVLDRSTGSLTYARAGHPPPLVVGADGSFRFLTEAQNRPLGLGGRRPAVFHTVTLRAGDTVIFYTDGLIDRRDVEIDASLSRLGVEAALLRNDDVDVLGHLLVDRVLEGAKAEDDVCLLAIRFTGADAAGS